MGVKLQISNIEAVQHLLQEGKKRKLQTQVQVLGVDSNAWTLGIGRFRQRILVVMSTFSFDSAIMQKMLTKSNKNFRFFLTSYPHH